MNGLHTATSQELTQLIKRLAANPSGKEAREILSGAHKLRLQKYGNKVFVRGLVECSSYCVQNCLYCGLRQNNTAATRSRLTPKEILKSCIEGKKIGVSSFVLQAGEDPYFTDDMLLKLIADIKENVPGCAITLSLGVKPKHTLAAFYAAGADRYLLRHETATPEHFAKLHPPSQNFAIRRQTLYHLLDIGFQTGAGFMVGSPWQSFENLAADLIFLRQLQPHMVGVGPFIPHNSTPFKNQPPGSLELTLIMVALVRLLLPNAMLPATTALGSLHPEGREKALLAGANVVMPNISPHAMRGAYHLYNGKLSSGTEAAEGIHALAEGFVELGLQADFSRGDYKKE